MKFETTSSPVGDYLIPIYDKGQYSIKISAPEGFHFGMTKGLLPCIHLVEPATFNVDFDDMHTTCNNGKDINFELTGFNVKGKV